MTANRLLRLLPALLVFSALGAAAACDDASDRAAFDRPVPRIGQGLGYRLPPAGADVRGGRPVMGLRCGPRAPSDRFGVHLEVFANHFDVIVPAGIGVAPPLSRKGAYVTGGRCSYPARTLEPTGLIEVAKGSELTLGQFFGLWAQPLGPRKLLGFRGPVTAFVDGRH